MQSGAYQTKPSATRIHELDFLKCICILLMIVFHLVFISEKYPYAKQIVYTFHMPIFLLISGYLVHADRPAKRFFTSQFWIFVPYVIMELPYLILSGMLGVRGGETNLSPLHLLYRLVADPLGPYWYLHTLLICNILLWCVQKVLHSYHYLVRLLAFGSLLAVMVYGTHLVDVVVIYYFFGTCISLAGLTFLQVFRPSWIALFIAGVLCAFPSFLGYGHPMGWVITYSVISFLLWIYGYAHRLTPRLSAGMQWIGINTLPLFLFSPIFTMAVKPLVPVFLFDPTGMLFLCVALTIAVVGSLGIAYVLDCLHLSPYLVGRKELLIRKVQA